MKIGSWDSDSGKTFVIAECGVNHNGIMDIALQLIVAARDAGADAVKFQWFNTDALIARRGQGAAFLRDYELWAMGYERLKAEAERNRLTFLCSVFDLASAEAYLALDPAAVKIGSGELREWALLKRVAGHPVILSTGMADMRDVSLALSALRVEDLNIALLHCVSAYPTPEDQVNLRALDALKAYTLPVGYSDHTIGVTAALCAVARGAVIIEKHLTLDCGLPGPDHKASANPRTFADMVCRIRDVEELLGDGVKRVMSCEAATMKAVGR